MRRTGAVLLVGLAVVAAGIVVASLRVTPSLYFAGYVILQYVVIATAWNILGGYGGYVNFGTPAFFALGRTPPSSSSRRYARRCPCSSWPAVWSPHCSGSASAISRCACAGSSSPSPPWRCPLCSRR